MIRKKSYKLKGQNRYSYVLQQNSKKCVEVVTAIRSVITELPQFYQQRKTAWIAISLHIHLLWNDKESSSLRRFSVKVCHHLCWILNFWQNQNFDKGAVQSPNQCLEHMYDSVMYDHYQRINFCLRKPKILLHILRVFTLYYSVNCLNYFSRLNTTYSLVLASPMWELVVLLSLTSLWATVALLVNKTFDHFSCGLNTDNNTDTYSNEVFKDAILIVFSWNPWCCFQWLFLQHSITHAWEFIDCK